MTFTVAALRFLRRATPLHRIQTTSSRPLTYAIHFSVRARAESSPAIGMSTTAAQAP